MFNVLPPLPGGFVVAYPVMIPQTAAVGNGEFSKGRPWHAAGAPLQQYGNRFWGKQLRPPQAFLTHQLFVR